MDQLDDELREIKREIIESRGLVIKTNNLTNALSADLKSIAKRQQGYERRITVNSYVMYVVFVFVALAIIKVAWDARVDSVEARTDQQRQLLEKQGRDLREAQKRDEDRAKAEARASAFYELVRQNKRAELVDQWDSLEKTALTKTEQAFFADAVLRARSELSIVAYHLGLEHARVGRWHEAQLAFEESLRYQDGAAHSSLARYNLADAMRRLGRQRDAIPMLMQLSEASPDKEVMDDATWLLAQCLVDIQAWNDAKNALRTFIRRFESSPHLNDARLELADLALHH